MQRKYTGEKDKKRADKAIGDFKEGEADKRVQECASPGNPPLTNS